MELRVAMCQTGAGSAGVRCGADHDFPPIFFPSAAHGLWCAVSRLPISMRIGLNAAARLASQGILGKELRCCQGRFPEAAHPCAREQRQRREAHRHLRCALRRVEYPCRVPLRQQCPPTHLGFVCAVPAEFGVEKTVDVEGMSADAFKSQLETLMKASS